MDNVSWSKGLHAKPTYLQIGGLDMKFVTPRAQKAMISPKESSYFFRLRLILAQYPLLYILVKNLHNKEVVANFRGT
jgi:hypothetical protein